MNKKSITNYYSLRFTIKILDNLKILIKIKFIKKNQNNIVFINLWLKIFLIYHKSLLY